ncbi:MAG TPA: hypothetical protein PKN75_14610 [Bacteroidia bacterium]|nr:hypothetical protein [Bacteroidia bacterium]HNU34817.1 hypothetical protein [Bacteroidia bacterium]
MRQTSTSAGISGVGVAFGGLSFYDKALKYFEQKTKFYPSVLTIDKLINIILKK